jgi:Gpi18-like mannosyltransferase
MKSLHYTFYFFLFLIFIFFLPTTRFELDMFCWKEWTKFIFDNGLQNAYRSGTDYMPLMQYFMYGFGLIQGSIENIEKNINYIKIIPIVFDFLGGFILLKIIEKKIYAAGERFNNSLFFFLNIAIFYNALFWGQVDGVLSTLVFTSIYFAIEKKLSLAYLFLVIAVNFKLQAIIFIPVLVFLTLPDLISFKTGHRAIIIIALIISVQLIILLPFILNNDLLLVIKAVRESFSKYPVISMNSAGVWNLFIPGDLSHTPDSILFLGIKLKTWGLVMFFMTSFVALLPLIKVCLHQLTGKQTFTVPLNKVFIICGLIPLLFSYLNTEMHERYLHPALIFLVTYSIISRNFVPTILICLAYTLNLEHAIQVLHLKTYGTLPFSRIFLAIIYLICIILLFNKLYDSKILDFRSLKTKPD